MSFESPRTTPSTPALIVRLRASIRVLTFCSVTDPLFRSPVRCVAFVCEPVCSVFGRTLSGGQVPAHHPGGVYSHHPGGVFSWRFVGKTQAPGNVSVGLPATAPGSKKVPVISVLAPLVSNPAVRKRRLRSVPRMAPLPRNRDEVQARRWARLSGHG